MNIYTVQVAPTAAERISQCGRYIAEQSRSVDIAKRWVDRVYDSIETLSVFPLRNGLAEESAHRPFEIRVMVIGNYLTLYTVDEPHKIVKVVGFRHGARLPQPDDIPVDET